MSPFQARCVGEVGIAVNGERDLRLAGAHVGHNGDNLRECPYFKQIKMMCFALACVVIERYENNMLYEGARIEHLNM